MLCLPLNIVAKLNINLSPELMQAAKEVNYSNSAKMGLAMKRRFWEEDEQILGGITLNEEVTGEIWYPSTGFLGRKGVGRSRLSDADCHAGDDSTAR